MGTISIYSLLGTIHNIENNVPIILHSTIINIMIMVTVLSMLDCDISDLDNSYVTNVF